MILGSSLEGAHRLTQSAHETTELLYVAYQTEILSLFVINYRDWSRQLAQRDF